MGPFTKPLVNSTSVDGPTLQRNALFHILRGRAAFMPNKKLRTPADLLKEVIIGEYCPSGLQPGDRVRAEGQFSTSGPLAPRDEGLTLLLSNVVSRADVRVIERRRRL